MFGEWGIDIIEKLSPTLPNNSMTAPTLELKSSHISNRQLHRMANTQLSSSGNQIMRWLATGSRQDEAIEQTSLSLSSSLWNRFNKMFHGEQDTWRKGAYPSMVASTRSLRIILLHGLELFLMLFTWTRLFLMAVSYFISRRPACQTSHMCVSPAELCCPWSCPGGP